MSYKLYELREEQRPKPEKHAKAPSKKQESIMHVIAESSSYLDNFLNNVDKLADEAVRVYEKHGECPTLAVGKDVYYLKGQDGFGGECLMGKAIVDYNEIGCTTSPVVIMNTVDGFRYVSTISTEEHDKNKRLCAHNDGVVRTPVFIGCIDPNSSERGHSLLIPINPIGLAVGYECITNMMYSMTKEFSDLSLSTEDYPMEFDRDIVMP